MWDRETLKKKRVGVLLGGMSSEREVSLTSGKAILKALVDLGYSAFPIEADERLADRIAKEKIEVAFIGLHGALGEDGSVQGLLEMLRIPYTGSGILASALSMNKLVSRQIFVQNGLAVPRYVFFAERGGAAEKLSSLPFAPPVVVKPCQEGSSVGVAIVSSPREIREAAEKAFEYGGGVLIEEFIKGREIQTGVLDNTALGSIEIVPKQGFYDYRAKYTDGLADHFFPAPIPAEDYRKSLDLALKAHRLLGCEGGTRVDFMYRGPGEFFLLEVNSLPGMTPLSLLTEIARGAGIAFPDLVERILLGARLRIRAHPFQR
ncbi:MAG TPA: D-alanine--D-alanine ligase [Thermodesulfobacteriota bacterium]|nr:D-alanine--D-alanine ligase [Thermodesulfobacteriota bacterium]